MHWESGNRWGLWNSILRTREDYAWQLRTIDSPFHLGRWVFGTIQKLCPSNWKRLNKWKLIWILNASTIKSDIKLSIFFCLKTVSNEVFYFVYQIAYESIHKEKGHYHALSMSRKNVLALVPQVRSGLTIYPIDHIFLIYKN